jgi:hypothetical protein
VPVKDGHWRLLNKPRPLLHIASDKRPGAADRGPARLGAAAALLSTRASHAMSWLQQDSRLCRSCPAALRCCRRLQAASSPEEQQAAVEAARAKIKRLADNYMAKQQEVLAEILPQNVSPPPPPCAPLPPLQPCCHARL